MIARCLYGLLMVTLLAQPVTVLASGASDAPETLLNQQELESACVLAGDNTGACPGMSEAGSAAAAVCCDGMDEASCIIGCAPVSSAASGSSLQFEFVFDAVIPVNVTACYRYQSPFTIFRPPQAG